MARKNIKKTRFRRKTFKRQRKGISKLSALKLVTGMPNIQPVFQSIVVYYNLQLTAEAGPAANVDLGIQIDLAQSMNAGSLFQNMYRSYNMFRLLSVTFSGDYFPAGKLAAGVDSLQSGPQIFYSTAAGQVPEPPDATFYLPHQGSRVFKAPGTNGTKFRFVCVPSLGNNIFTRASFSTEAGRLGRFGYIYTRAPNFFRVPVLDVRTTYTIASFQLKYNFYAWDKGTGNNNPVNGLHGLYDVIHLGSGFSLKAGQTLINPMESCLLEYDQATRVERLSPLDSFTKRPPFPTGVLPVNEQVDSIMRNELIHI